MRNRYSGYGKEWLPGWRVDTIWEKWRSACNRRKYRGRDTYSGLGRGGGWGGHRRWRHGQRRGGTRWRFTGRQKAGTDTESWRSMGKEPRWMRESCGPSEEPMRFCGVSEDEGVTRQTWRRRCKECWTAHKRGRDGRKKCRRGRGGRSYQEMASACIGHSARWTERGAGQQQKRCAKRSRRGRWRGPQNRAGRGES